MTFAWDRTRPDSSYDFTAAENGIHVGRIWRMTGGPQDKMWSWSCTGCQRGSEAAETRPLSGIVATRDDAIDALGQAWSRAKVWSARTGFPLT